MCFRTRTVAIISIVCANISQTSDYIHEGIENRLSTGNAYYHLVQNLCL